VSHSQVKFGRAPRDKWLLCNSIADKRRTLLLDPPKFEKIIQRICDEMQVVDHRRERHKTDARFYRFSARLECDSRSVDLFFNSSTGYRAQYYLDPSTGEKANKYACSEIAAVVLARLEGSLKRTCSRKEWLERSVQDSNAKLWINQGLWLRRAKLSDRQILVHRWQESSRHLECGDVNKLGKWAPLVPDVENCIVFKGGFWTLDATERREAKQGRSDQIHRFGFT
jgi:hypothetical protein